MFAVFLYTQGFFIKMFNIIHKRIIMLNRWEVIFMIKNYILDTNVLIHDPESIYKFQDNNVVIPIIVIEELDNMKNREGMPGFQARNAAREINKVRSKGSLSDGVKLPGGGLLKIELNHTDYSKMPVGFDKDKNDNKIIAVAKAYMAEYPEIPTVLVSKDLYLSIKGESLGVVIQDYENDKVKVEELYSGYCETKMSSSDIDRIYKGGLPASECSCGPIFPNQFVHIKSTDNISHEVLAICKSGILIPLKYQNNPAWGLTPLNREQRMAFELLMDPDIPFVTITGGAGSGKTIMATAVALQKVIEEEVYRKIVFVKPVVPTGNDIGYLPGTEEEKLRPWMGAFYDAIDNLFGSKMRRKEKVSKMDNQKPNFTVDSFIEDYRQQGILETKSFTYMRGRTLTDSLVIVDETQEITPHLAKMMLTRAGFGSKFVFIGDPTNSQIDNLLVDERSNGLVYTMEKMKPFDISGHVTLNKVERSPLASISEKYM